MPRRSYRLKPSRSSSSTEFWRASKSKYRTEQRTSSEKSASHWAWDSASHRLRRKCALHLLPAPLLVRTHRALFEDLRVRGLGELEVVAIVRLADGRRARHLLRFDRLLSDRRVADRRPHGFDGSPGRGVKR